METMAEIKWNDRFNLDVEEIDKAHQKLFTIVNKLIAFTENPEKQQHACKEGIKYFKNYAVKHFAEEEAYMQALMPDCPCIRACTTISAIRHCPLWKKSLRLRIIL